MEFKKLALAAAVAAAPMSALALEPVSDATLSGVTGQDGISIGLETNLSMDILVHDTDGFTGNTDSGAIVIENFGLSSDGGTGDAIINLDIDAGANTGADPTLQINVSLGDTATSTDTVIDMGELRVANSNRTATSTDAADWGATNTTTGDALIDLGSITLGAGTDLTIQLGNEPQGNMIALATTITNGINIANFALNDAGGTITGGAIGASNVAIIDNGGANLTTDIGIDADTNGLVVSLNQLGDAANGIDVQMVDQYLGTTGGVIGDVEITGLNLNGTTLTITGH
ncbi:MAG: hypothetical protein MI745_09260 [Pseudomonadales bacterium]|nr:hypothetical protein [Pseudomonadales bacterium]